MLSFMTQGLQGGLRSGSPRYDSQDQGQVLSTTAAHILVVGNCYHCTGMLGNVSSVPVSAKICQRGEIKT